MMVNPNDDIYLDGGLAMLRYGWRKEGRSAALSLRQRPFAGFLYCSFSAEENL